MKVKAIVSYLSLASLSLLYSCGGGETSSSTEINAKIIVDKPKEIRDAEPNQPAQLTNTQVNFLMKTQITLQFQAH